MKCSKAKTDKKSSTKIVVTVLNYKARHLKIQILILMQIHRRTNPLIAEIITAKLNNIINKYDNQPQSKADPNQTHS